MSNKNKGMWNNAIPAIMGLARLVEAGDTSAAKYTSTNYRNDSRNVVHRGEQGHELDPDLKPQS